MTFDKVVKIIAEQLGMEDISEITETTSLADDLEADSLDAVEIIMSIEDEFDIEILDEDIENFKYIGDIVDYIDANK